MNKVSRHDRKDGKGPYILAFVGVLDLKKLLMAGLAKFNELANAVGSGLMNGEVSASNPVLEVIIPYKSVNAAKSSVRIRFDL